MNIGLINRIEYYFTIFFGILWLLDTFLTCIFVTMGGYSLEYNPILRWIMENTGLGLFVFIKLALLVLYGKLIVDHSWNRWIAPILCVIMIPVIFDSLRLILFLMELKP